MTTPTNVTRIGDSGSRGLFSGLTVSEGATIAPSVKLPAAEAFTGDYATLTGTPIATVGTYGTGGVQINNMQIFACNAFVGSGGTTVVNATVGGTASGAAIFSNVSSVQVMCMLFNAPTTGGVLNTVRSVSPDLKQITIYSILANGNTVAAGTRLFVLVHGF